MKKLLTYLVLPLLLMASSCHFKKKTSWNVTLRSEDKIPYGSYIAYHSLSYYFPAARIEALSKGFRYESIEGNMVYHNNDSAAILVLNGLSFYATDNEVDNLLHFVRQGNELFLICNTLDAKLANRLGCERMDGDSDEELPVSDFNPGKRNIAALKMISDTNKTYGMNGRSLQGYFTLSETTDTMQSQTVGITGADTAVDYIERNPVTVNSDEPEDAAKPDILSRGPKGPNLIRYRIGSGHITLLATPLALSNYFLLQKDNRHYADQIWHTFPANISSIYWNDYFKRRIKPASFWALFDHPATGAALAIALITLLLYVLFEAKRRQAIIPVVPKLENSSVSFVETVGRLYYNKGNHRNLAEKMVQHYLEWVRTHYYLNTNQINEIFIQQLTIKSGLPEMVVREMVRLVHEVRIDNVAIDEAYLYHLHNTIQQFYKNND